MLVAFAVAPSSADATGAVTDAVARAVAIVRASGLPTRTDAMFTPVEGTWDECMTVVRDCVEALAEGSPRVSLVLKADIRPGRDGELTAKLDRLESALAQSRSTEPSSSSEPRSSTESRDAGNAPV